MYLVTYDSYTVCIARVVLTRNYVAMLRVITLDRNCELLCWYTMLTSIEDEAYEVL
jgi:hypothetical protein